MPKSPAQQQIPLGNSLVSEKFDPRDPAWKAWQARVDHGLIGSRPVMTFEKRLRHMRNEIALCGRIVTRELEEF